MIPAQERIEQEASLWLASRDAGAASAARSDEFDRWLDADIRNRVAYLRLEAGWRRAERLQELRPLDRDVDADLFKQSRLQRRWPLAAAASLALTLLLAGLWLLDHPLGWQHYETHIGGFSRIVLEDGSVVDLNTNSEVRVRLRADRREVRLLRGESRFMVAHDATRPFVVSVAGAAVRAVGTAFSVRLRESAQVDVLVSEGKVAIASAHVSRGPPLNAGEAAVVLPDRVSVSLVPPRELESRLAWTAGRLEFRGEKLADAVAEFNRYNRRQIELADAAFAGLRVGGNFNATDPESFAAAVASAFNLRVAHSDSDAIVIRPP